MTLRVYADESYTTKAEALCGFMATSEEWARFSRRLKAVLKNFGAPYFHFREFADIDNKSKIPNNPFLTFSWNAKKRDLFVHELAIVLSDAAVPVGGVLNVKRLPSNSTDGVAMELLIAQFYSHFSYQLNSHWPGFDGRVSFVFDETGNETWIATLGQIHKKAQELEPRIGELTFENDIKCPPLQAADLFAYICRQNTEKYYAQGMTKQYKRTLDWILSKNAYPNFKKIHTKDSWERLVRMVLAHRQKLKAIWTKNGVPSRAYLPELDFKAEAEKLGLPLIDADKV